ncbi:MAG TPA: alkaline phosphatase family protein, partial [Planctomycetota bacterium]|nr:alkaline phosphatase family protein [Planctomycetota bacterium]
GWKWERGGPDSAYAGLVDDRPFESAHHNGGNAHTLPQTLTGGREHADQAFYAVAYASPVANEAIQQAALAALAGEDLGTDAVPDLFCVSFSGNDAVGHTFGADSTEARDTLLRLDRLLAQLLRELDQRVGKGRYAFLLSADHGVGPTPEQAKLDGKDAGRAPVTSRARAAAEQALVAKYGKQEGKRYVAMAQEGVLYLDRSVVGAGVEPAAVRWREACSEAATAAALVPGMATAFATWELLQNGAGAEPIRRAMYYAAFPDRSGDVLLVIKPYWLDGALVASHGTPHPYDREVPLLAMGPGVRAGNSCAAAVSPGLCAVLAARLLGMQPPAAARDELPDGVLPLK